MMLCHHFKPLSYVLVSFSATLVTESNEESIAGTCDHKWNYVLLGAVPYLCPKASLHIYSQSD